MPITFDSSTIDSSSSSRPDASFSFNNVAGDSLVIIANVHDNNLAVPIVSTITYNTVSLTKQATSANTDGLSNLESTIWTLDNPATGSNTVVATFIDDEAESSSIICLSYSGANNGVGSNFITASTGDGTSISDSFTTENSDSLIIAGGMIYGGDTDPFSIGGDLDSERADGATGTHTSRDSGYFAADGAANAASDTATFTASTGDKWTLVAIELLAAAGGTEYTQSAAGGVSFGGAIVKETAVNYAGVLSFAGSISKLIQVAYAGVLSFSGDVSKKTNALYSGGLSFAGSIAKKTLKPLSGGASFVGGLATRLVKLLSLAGGISFNGDVSRKISKVFGGALPLSGVLSRSTGKLLAGVQDFSGNIVKKTAVLYAGVVSFAGAIAARLVKLLSLSGGISFNGDISKLPKKSLAGVASFTGGISKKITHTLQGSLSFAGAIYKKTITTLQGSLSFIGSLAASISSTVTAYTLTLYKRTNILKVKKRTNELNVYERDNDLTIEDNTK